MSKQPIKWTPRAKALGDFMLVLFIGACCMAILILGLTIGEHNHCEWAKANHVSDGC